MTPIRITHFSDVLCIWAYIAQIRIDELQSEFGEQIEIEYRLFPVFGSVHQKIESSWGEEGYKAYSLHVQKVVDGFEHVSVHADVWKIKAPKSSLPPHLYLCAIRLLEQKQELGDGVFAQIAWLFREAFFKDLQDISDAGVLRRLIKQAGLPLEKIEQRIDSGEAYAELSEDMKLASDNMIKASPTLLFNEGRQRLTGNVGYKIIEANIRELLQKSGDQQSWC